MRASLLSLHVSDDGASDIRLSDDAGKSCQNPAGQTSCQAKSALMTGAMRLGARIVCSSYAADRFQIGSFMHMPARTLPEEPDTDHLSAASGSSSRVEPVTSRSADAWIRNWTLGEARDTGSQLAPGLVLAADVEDQESHTAVTSTISHLGDAGASHASIVGSGESQHDESHTPGAEHDGDWTGFECEASDWAADAGDWNSRVDPADSQPETTSNVRACLQSCCALKALTNRIRSRTAPARTTLFC